MSLVSMTGFGASTFEAMGAIFGCTARSVNRRYFDISVRLPQEFAHLEPAIRAVAQQACGRGEVAIAVEREGGRSQDVEVDEAAARAVYDGFRRVAAAVGSEEAVPLAAVLTAPGVVRYKSPSPCADKAEDDFIAGVRRALDSLVEARQREGNATETALVGLVDSVSATWSGVRAEARAASEALSEKALARARALAASAGADVSPDALANAVVTLAEKADITEEVSRMEAHIAAVRAALAGPPPHGRRLDFLCQEMGREATTTSAKAQSSAVSHLVVQVKADVERIREIVANVL